MLKKHPPWLIFESVSKLHVLPCSTGVLKTTPLIYRHLQPLWVVRWPGLSKLHFRFQDTPILLLLHILCTHLPPPNLIGINFYFWNLPVAAAFSTLGLNSREEVFPGGFCFLFFGKIGCLGLYSGWLILEYIHFTHTHRERESDIHACIYVILGFTLSVG